MNLSYHSFSLLYLNVRIKDETKNEHFPLMTQFIHEVLQNM